MGAKKFLESSQWYGDRGIPYRRGYLLHGPPGCGKTSFTQVLAGALKLDMCMLSLSNAQLDDQKLAQNFREAPENAIILLEDVMQYSWIAMYKKKEKVVVVL